MAHLLRCGYSLRVTSYHAVEEEGRWISQEFFPGERRGLGSKVLTESLRFDIDRDTSRFLSNKNGMLVKENLPNDFMALILSFGGMVGGDVELYWLSHTTDPPAKESTEPDLP